MDTRPQIDIEKLHNILEADKSYHNELRQSPIKFCGSDCREAYREDRIAGKVLAPVSMNGQTVSHRQMCAIMKVCGYCLSELEK